MPDGGDIFVYVNANSVDELAERLYRLTEGLARRSGTSTLRVLEDSGATPAQMKALIALSRGDGALSVGELAGALSLSVPTASRTAEALHRLGFVERRVGTEDRRARELGLTPAGEDLVRRVSTARVADLRVVVESLDDEQRERLNAALTELGIGSPVAA